MNNFALKHDKVLAVLKSVAAPHAEGKAEHSWRKCRHCLAVQELEVEEIGDLLGELLKDVAALTDERTTEADSAEILSSERSTSDGPRDKASSDCSSLSCASERAQLQEALGALVAKWRERGERNCPDIQPPHDGWSAVDMVARPLGAAYLFCADELAEALERLKR